MNQLFAILITGMSGVFIASLTLDKHKMAPGRTDRPGNSKIPPYIGATDFTPVTLTSLWGRLFPEQASGTQRMYQLIRQPGPITDRLSGITCRKKHRFFSGSIKKKAPDHRSF